MNHHTITEAERLPDAHRQGRVTPRLALEIVLAEDVGRQQPGTAHVPVGRITWVTRMVEHRDSQGGPIDLPGVIQPFRFLAPHVFLGAFILRVYDLPGAFRLRDVLWLILLVSIAGAYATRTRGSIKDLSVIS